MVSRELVVMRVLIAQIATICVSMIHGYLDTFILSQLHLAKTPKKLNASHLSIYGYTP